MWQLLLRNFIVKHAKDGEIQWWVTCWEITISALVQQMVSEPNHVFDRCASVVSISQQCASVVDGGGRVCPSHNDRGMREVRVWPS